MFSAQGAFLLAIYIEIIIAFVFGFGASLATWKYLLFLKPNIRISPYVLKGPSRIDRRKVLYRIKVMNFGSRQAINLVAKWSVVKVTGTPGIDERWVTIKHLPLNFETVPALGPKHSVDDLWGISPFFVFTTNYVNVEKLLSNNDRLRFILTATDASSQTTIVQHALYTKEKIKSGDFTRKLDFAILEQVPEASQFKVENASDIS